MIDLHSHILPGLDDGPSGLEESLDMCRVAYGDGIRTIVATPHMLDGVYRARRAAVLSRTRELNAALSSVFPVCPAGRRLPHSAPDSSHSELRTPNSELDSSHSALRTRNSTLDSSDSALRSPHSEFGSNSELVVLPGADIHLAEDLLHPSSRKQLVTVGDRGKYLLVEFPSQVIPPMAERILFRLIGQGIVPIITHPERNLEIGRKPSRYYEMIRMGCLGQVTAMSLTGGFGPEARRLAEALLIRRLVHLIASDAHSTDLRPPVLTPAVTAAAKLVGANEAARMVIEYPQAVLDGEKPDLPPPIPI